MVLSKQIWGGEISLRGHHLTRRLRRPKLYGELSGLFVFGMERKCLFFSLWLFCFMVPSGAAYERPLSRSVTPAPGEASQLRQLPRIPDH